MTPTFGGNSAAQGRAFAARWQRTGPWLPRILALTCFALAVVVPALAAMTFLTPSVENPSMYQTVQLSLESNPLVQDPKITTGDLIFFVASDNTASCVYNGTPTATTPGYYAVTAMGSDGYTGRLILPMVSTVFNAGAKYYPCYLSSAQKSATIVRRGFTQPGSSDAMSVWPPLYTSLDLNPTSVNGGEGPVTLSIVQADLQGRPINEGLTGRYTILLVPCGNVSVGEGTTVQSDCADLNALVTTCDTVGSATTSPAGVIPLVNLQGQSSKNVKGSFTVPYSPNAAGYYICVPYCSSTSAGCGKPTTAMSFTVLASLSTSSSNYTLTFSNADPGVYTRSPAQPQARERGVMSFRGANLSAADTVKVIRSSDLCTSSTAALLSNLVLGTLQLTGEGEEVSTTTMSFVAPELVKAQMVGRVCYKRSASGLWSTVYLSAEQQKADFTIDILQPHRFAITAPATNPAVGETLTITFEGTGLDGSKDQAYLSSSSSSTNPCDRDGTESLLTTATTTSSSSSSRPTRGFHRNAYFTCQMSGTNETATTCTVIVDPDNTNSGMTLSVCYLKGRNAEQTNFAQISGVVTLQPRNPTYSVAPYPLFAGQSVSVQFTGINLTSEDNVKLIAEGGTCGDDTPALTTAAIMFSREISEGTVYDYTLVGAAETCIMVCYRRLGSDMWVIARGSDDMTSVSSSCAASNIYISAFPVRYTITNLGTSAGTTVGALLSVGETGTLRLSTVIRGSFSSSTTPKAIKLVRASDSCVTIPCGETPRAACAIAQASADYTSGISASGSAAFSASIQVSTAEVRYVVCMETTSSGGTYVPVLPSSEVSATSTTYGFTTALQNPTLLSHTPSTWRVSMSTLTTTFGGSNLDASKNTVYAVAASALLASYTTSDGTLVAVCPPVTQTPATILVSAMDTSSNDSATVRYTRADQLFDGITVYLCYSWSAGNGDSHITMAGAVKVSAAIPSSFTLVEPTVTTSLRAGVETQLKFTSNLTSLSAVNDSVFFYRYRAVSNPNPNCYCDPTACATGKRITYDTFIHFTGATTTIKDDTTIYTAFLGFSNYDFPAIYVICYTASGQSADTYMGRLTVGQANPAYYTVSSAAAPLNRVGAPISITVTRRCLTTACALTLEDSLLLVPSSVRCSQLPLDNPNGTSTLLKESSVQVIGGPVLGLGALTLTLGFVVDTEGTYHVCYRLFNDPTYSDLPFSLKYKRSLLTVDGANPQGATPVPSAPSAGQFVVMNLECATDTLCNTCRKLRLVPGVRSSCWATVPGTYSSDSCLTTTSMQYPDQYIASGDYTVCYGDNYITSRRIPGTFTVTPGNPLSYAPTASSGYSVYTNQGPDYILEINGTGLTTDDTAFLLPDMGYSCHDLRTNEVQSDGQLAKWLEPSVKPYPLQLTETGVSWTVSNQQKRFGGGLLDNTQLCPGNGAPCLMKLCYMRSGTSWAPVTLLEESTSTPAPPGIQLVASNPSSIEFDSYPLVIGKYVMATIQGAGLLSTDSVSIHGGTCSDAPITVSVVSAVEVNEAATQWRGVLRVTDASKRYSVCYWRSESSTEVATITFTGHPEASAILVLSTPLHYVLSPFNFTSMLSPLTQYEELIVGASFSDAGTFGVEVSYAQLVAADTSVAECNYAPFQAVASNFTAFPIVLTLSFVPGSGSSDSLWLYQGRLDIHPGLYALCMNTPNGLFRVVTTPPKASKTATSSLGVAVYDPVPTTYTTAPAHAMVGQLVTLTFSRDSADSTSDDDDDDDHTAPASANLAAGDVVQIIDASLFECGFKNATILVEGVVSQTEGSPSTAISLLIPETYTQGGEIVSAAERSYTVCYERQSGTFATSPLTGGTVDRNLYVMGQVPIKWTSSPTQAQVNAPVNIIFYGDDRVADYLTAEDVALLVLVPDGAVPGPSMCPRTEDWNRDDVIKADANYTIITQGTMTKPDAVNTQWAIPVNVLLQGVYVVCYKAKNSGQPVYVSSPATLVVYPTQSPSGAYLARSAASIEENLNLLQGERVFLLFHTTVELNVVLDDGQGSSKDKDVVRITTDNACRTPLGAGTIDEIPAAFGYAPLRIVNETKNLPVPYVHLRARATPGNYYVCMRRRNRESWQAYYDFEVVGGLHVNPAVLKVGDAAVSAFTTSPTTPRVWVPHVVVSATYGPGVSMESMKQFFFVPFTGTGSVTEIDEINHDSCYRPSSTSEASSASVTLVNRTLQVYLVNPMLTQHSFGLVSTYLLCYQQSGRNIASVFPTALTVANPSPTTYAVPEMIPIQNAFTMSFSAIDPIFAAGNNNVAQIYIVDDVMAMVNCLGATAPIGGTTHFTNFTVTHTTQASVTPTIMKSGYFFVCFLAYDQKEYFPVPNAAGDFIFSVGLMGAQEYTVTPSPAYLGQLLDVAIVGYQLSNRDHVKVVRISSDELSSEDDMTSDDMSSDDRTSDDRSSTTQCTKDAENADASEPAGAAGSVVQSTSGTLAHYYPRVNETGTFILCYQSVLWENAWIWVSKIPQFTVGVAHPTHYTLSVAPAYETEVLSLHIHDSGTGGTGTEGRLRPEDKVKLIDRGTGDRGFDCTASATTSSSVGLLSYVSAESNSRLNVYRICGSAVANLTICYALSEGQTEMLNWAEVPRQSPPPTYLFEGVLIESDPFVGPLRGSSGADWVPPRPYEPFTFFFTSAVAKLEVQRVDFAQEPVSVCAVDVDYVVPLLYQKEKKPASTFTVSLPHAGNYVVYISRDAAKTAPKIMHRTQLVVGKCDPCSFTPSYGLAGKDVLLSFRSSVGGSLSNADEVRLFPVPQGLKGRPCEEISGPYAGVTLKPIAGQSTSDLTVFSVTTGTETEASKYLGEYYVCYRKMAASSGSLTANFAVVAENNGVASIFSVYPADLLTATTCPALSMNALQSAVYKVTARDPVMYPNVPFSDSDVLVVVPSDVLEGIAGGCEGVTDVKTLITESGGRAQLATLDSYGRGYSNWYLTFASQTATVSYRWCFKLEYDALFRDISTSPQKVARENPYEVTTNPPVILPQSAPVQIQITGTGLVSTDRVYIVPAEESCLETCDRPAAPTEWQDVPHTVQYVSSTRVLVTFSKPIEALVSLGVCYRRTNQYLTRLASIVVREPNPVSYTTSFAPRVGTRPGLVFTGKSLTKGDALILVQPGTPCLVSDAVATGTFVSVSSDGTTSHFLLPLVGDGIRVQDYTVCYEISTVGAYAEVQPKLSVLEGGPSSVLSSNTPMRGRATVLTVADPQAGDEMYVACVGCSCFDEQEAVVPYGNVHAIAQVTKTESSSSNVTIALRVGFDDTKGYPICYRRSDSGYAQIGGTTTFVTPATNSPSDVTQLPASTQYQGQRLVYNFVNYTAAVPLDGADRVMLVQQSRSCWDNLDINKDGVVVGTSVLTGTIPATGVGEWKAHIPSLGPGVPPATPALFPLSYVVCYRQAGQLEYVGVPYAVQTTLMKAADPAIFETVPAIVEKGMLEVSTTFSYTDAGNDGDEAYVVQFETLTNTVCDDDKSVVVSPRGGAYPVYKLSMSGSAVVGTNRTAVCYIRAGATVAEVPQLLTVVESNPSGYVTNVADTGVARERQYIEFTIMGSDLSTANDAVVFTDVPCAKAPRPFTSSPYLARLGDATSDGATYKVVAQFISPDAPVNIYVCYQHNSVWREVGAALTLSVPVPLTVSVISSSETKTMPRAGQHLNLQLVGGTTTSVIDAAVLSARTAWKGTWCHNFTEDDVQEPALAIWSAAILDVSVWQVPGEARLCIHNDANTLWADAASTVDAPSIYINPPNPSTMDAFPHPPRVGQSVTLTFHLLVSSSAEDVVRVTTPSYEACETAKSVEAFPDTMSVTVVDEHTTTLTLVDSTDPLRYRSFETVGDYRVCYYSATELAWGVVGGTLTAGSVTVEERVPESWSIASGHTTIGLEFTLAFTDKLGILQPSVNKDVAWAAPSTVNCGQDPHTCSECLLFQWDTSKSSPNKAVTLANASVRVDEMNLCYRLSGATAALVPGPLNITTGPIQCVEEDFFISGQRQRVTFRIEDGTDVTEDSWRLSFYATTALNCDERYIDSFLPGSARLESWTSTSATYSVLWPPGLGITTEKYTICYTHKNLVGPVCTCGQIDAKTGECYMTGTPGSPQSFTPSPQPTYVGQTITLSLAVSASMTAYPPTAIKLVTYVDELTDCDGAPAFTPEGATLTRISAVLYTYVFKHDYTLGSATLVVCALTDLSTSYVRVASTVVPSSPTTSNTLWIRPYLVLTTFPSAEDYLRAMQTLSLTFTMESQQKDDVVSLKDRLTVVSDPRNCVESYINEQDPATLMKMFYLSDTAFLTLPATVLSANTAKFQTKSLATFSNDKVSQGTHYFCYLLPAGTWAPVLPALTIREALINSCSVTGALSPANGDHEDPSHTSTSNGGSLRAMYYAPTQILGTHLFASLVSPLVDEVRVVPQNQWCTNDAAAVFTITVGELSPLDGSRVDPTDSIAAVFFAPLSGAYKLCYRFGTNSNWSPACTDLQVTNSTPTGGTVGCLNVGQTVAVTLTQSISGQVFTNEDRLRFVQGTLPCLVSGGALTASSATVTVGDAPQPANGVVLSDVTPEQTVYPMAAALFRTGTSAVRLCYTDAAGNQFAVPLNYASDPGKSFFAIQPRQPSTVDFPHARVQVGQRLFMKFSPASAEVRPLLVPYAPLPSPYMPGPAFNGTFDGATLLAVSSASAYTDGRCAAALRDGTLAATSFLGVYGPPTREGGNGPAPYTVGNFDPTEAQLYIACYHLAKCGAADSGDPFRVDNANPSKVRTDVEPPRRGQLIKVLFERDTSTPGAAALTPGSDLGAKEANLASCWTLSDTAGEVVQGTSELTYITTIFPAQAPAQASPTQTRSCYKMSDGSWSEVPGGVADVLPANPASFDTVPASARVSGMNYINFYGSGFSGQDRVKLIESSANCSEDSVPPPSFAAYSVSEPTEAIPGTAQGWTVTGVNKDGSTATLNFVTTVTGTYSVCYRLAADTVWTLVYADLVIYERNPSEVTRTPVTTLEGELFTLTFTASTQGTSGLSAEDRVVLYYGSSVNCIAPTEAETAPSVTAAPSLTETLPQSISFQMDVGTRGSYTLCYKMALPGVPGGYIVVWDYDTVVVESNPQEMMLYPVREPSVHRPNELLTSLFIGWGLVSTTEAPDSMKLIQASAEGSTTDAMCQKNPSAATITYYPLYANGTHAEQVWRVSSDGVNVPYSVCYKLSGGQYHVIGNALSITGTASPSGATSEKLTGPTTTLLSGESISWTLVNTNAESCADGAAILFFSDSNCYDVHYYTDVSELISSSTLMEMAFPAGAVVVSKCSDATRLRASWSYAFAGSSSESPATAPPTALLSLCYWSAGNNAVSVLASDAITLSQGAPPPLNVSLLVTAEEVFRFDLSVSPTITDWIVLVKDPTDCVGVRSPANAAYFTDVEFNATTGVLTVTAAVPAAGMYYVCYAHQVGICAAATGRECARVVAAVEATASSPQSWSGTPTPVYVSGHLAISLTFASHSESSARETTASAWLAAMKDSESSLTMKDVWMACAQSQTTPSLRHVLTYTPASGKWDTGEILTRSGPYALCYTAESIETAALHLFGPVTNAGPVVLPSTVTDVSLPPLMTIKNTNTVVLRGGGLSTTDVVVAVALDTSTSSTFNTAARAIPSDICTNEDYVPRVISTNPDSTTSTGMSSMLRNLVFTETGDYVLCYTATYSLTTGDRASERGSPVLITPTPFTVSPSVVSMTVTSLVLEVGVELDILFAGDGLTTSNTAALVFVGNTTESPTVQSVCLDSNASYEAMKSASEDGTTAVYSTTPTQEGIHMVCFRQSSSSTPILMPTRLDIGVRSAIEAVFTVQPDGCAALLTCIVQPTITLLDTSALPTSAPYSTVKMVLYLSDGTTEAPPGYLSGDTAHSQVNYTTFTFLALRVSTSGQYVMKAIVELPGGDTLVATSDVVNVTTSGESVVNVASVSCLPEGILDRTSGSTTDTINCTIEVLINDAPNMFTVDVNAGTVSTVTQSGTTSGGLPMYKFTVTAPEMTPSLIGLVNYIVMLVKPITPFEGWPVQNSPVTVRLATSPSAQTTIGCSADATELPQSNMVRVGGTLNCRVQGVATIGGQSRNIVARPQDLRVTSYYNAQESTSTPVDLGAYPVDINGLYKFTVTPSTGLSIFVAGSVFASEYMSTSTTTTTPAWAVMTNSPQMFILIGVPADAASKMTCVSKRTGSKLWYKPTELLECTVALANAQGPVNGVQSDYSVQLPNGGSVSEVEETLWGSSLTWQISAPPQPSLSSLSSTKSQQHAEPVDAEGGTFDDGAPWNFHVRVLYTPSNTIISTYEGTLVSVMKVVGTVPTLKPGKTVSLTLAGFGLATTHLYTLSAPSNCSSELAQATPHEGRETDQLILNFRVPSSTFIICFAPEDARTALQPLLPTQWTPASGNPWTADDLVLLIVGVIFLLILLVLLVILLWCIFYGRRGNDEEEDENKATEEHRIMHFKPIKANSSRFTTRPGGKHVYMPPRANDRYVLRTADKPRPIKLQSPAPLPMEATPTPPPQEAQQQQQQQQQQPSSNNTHIRINIRDNSESDHATPHPQSTPGAAMSLMHPGGGNSNNNSGDARPPLPKRRRRHHSHRTTTTSSNDNLVSDHPVHPLRHQSQSKYANLDYSIPPLPPMPSATPSAIPGLVESPRNGDETPATHAVENLPRLPPPPASLSGPYQHLHHRAPEPTVPGRVDAPGAGQSSLHRRRRDDGATEEFVGPFTVVGHTSKPMVRSSSWSGKPQTKRA